MVKRASLEEAGKYLMVICPESIKSKMMLIK